MPLSAADILKKYQATTLTADTSTLGEDVRDALPKLAEAGQSLTIPFSSTITRLLSFAGCVDFAAKRWRN